MGWAKSPPALIAAFEAAFPDDLRAERRKMFGYPAGFVNGNLFAGLWQQTCIVRLPETTQQRLSAEGGYPFEYAPGRFMKAYLALPPEILGDAERFADWLARAFEHGALRPPKPPRAARAKTRVPKRR